MAVVDEIMMSQRADSTLGSYLYILCPGFAPLNAKGKAVEHLLLAHEVKIYSLDIVP
jgi:hypothetical protein